MNKTKMIMLSVTMAMACVTGQASAKGCIKGALVGGVGGHLAGGHKWTGAAAGCLVGRHLANKKDKEAAARQAQAAQQQAQRPVARR